MLVLPLRAGGGGGVRVVHVCVCVRACVETVCEWWRHGWGAVAACVWWCKIRVCMRAWSGVQMVAASRVLPRMPSGRSLSCG